MLRIVVDESSPAELAAGLGELAREGSYADGPSARRGSHRT